VAPIARRLRVPRSARYYLLGDPERPAEIWFACHGYGQLAAQFAGALEPLDDGHRLIAVPEALSRFYLDEAMKRHGPDSPVGASWMTREDRDAEIADQVEYLDLLAETLAPVSERRVRRVALGFSQGVATVARWAARGRTRLDRVILWGGTLPTELAERSGAPPFGAASVTLVAGERDALVPVATLERTRAALAERGVAVRLEAHPGGHALNGDLLRRLASGQ
jgi:predicted esterase